MPPITVGQLIVALASHPNDTPIYTYYLQNGATKESLLGFTTMPVSERAKVEADSGRWQLYESYTPEEKAGGLI